MELASNSQNTRDYVVCKYNTEVSTSFMRDRNLSDYSEDTEEEASKRNGECIEADSPDFRRE